MGLMDLIDLYI